MCRRLRFPDPFKSPSHSVSLDGLLAPRRGPGPRGRPAGPGASLPLCGPPALRAASAFRCRGGPPRVPNEDTRGGSLSLVLTPDELRARLATLVPPPRVHSVFDPFLFPAGRGFGSQLSPDYRVFCNLDPALLGNTEIASMLRWVRAMASVSASIRRRSRACVRLGRPARAWSGPARIPIEPRLRAGAAAGKVARRAQPERGAQSGARPGAALLGTPVSGASGPRALPVATRNRPSSIRSSSRSRGKKLIPRLAEICSDQTGQLRLNKPPGARGPDRPPARGRWRGPPRPNVSIGHQPTLDSDGRPVHLSG